MLTRRKFASTLCKALLASLASSKISLAAAQNRNTTSGTTTLVTKTARTTSAVDDQPAIIHPDHLKVIPSSKETIPSIGMGTWITFDVPDNERIRILRSRVLQEFFNQGGRMIDSSPMYGTAEEVLGFCLKQTGSDGRLFAASKIWTPLALEAGAQMANTEKLWGVQPMDLMYVHNLLNLESHLPKLRDWKSTGRIRYLGVSTSHGRRHQRLEKLLQSEVLDFVQLTYNYDQRVAEERLIPLARDHGVAVIVNRPFQRGHLIDKYRKQPLPGLAKELGCNTWAQFLLYFTVSHPDVTVAIPATSRVDHMTENMHVMQLPLADRQTRIKL